jgi:hypothetical protein
LLCTSLLGFFLFHEPVQTSIQSQVVIEQLRGGTRDSNSFVTPTNPHPSGQGSSQNQGSSQGHDYNPKPKTAPNMNSGGNGGSGSNDAINDNDISPSDAWRTYSDYWKHYRSDFSQNKKKLSEQCDLDENSQDASRTFTEKLDESSAVKKLVKRALKDQDVKNEYDKIKTSLQKVVNPIDIGPKTAPVQWQRIKY